MGAKSGVAGLLWVMKDAEGKSVLVVEDDAATAGFLADNLRADGFVVFGATGAGEALRAIDVR
ncbi:MAG: hypothetical protein QOH08_409, partial [Chloroflexota bacterium]|nr:hypothetical protein [Chloroflexota bacterium]